MICKLSGTVTQTKRILPRRFMRIAERPLEIVEPNFGVETLVGLAQLQVCERRRDANWNSKVVQRNQGFWLYSAE